MVSRRLLSRRIVTPPRRTLSMRMRLESRGGVAIADADGCMRGLAAVSRGCVARGIGTAPGTMRTLIGVCGMLLSAVSTGREEDVGGGNVEKPLVSVDRP